MDDDPAGAERPRHGVLADRYELLEVVGSGGMGTVYRSHDRVLGRTVAVKTIRRGLADAEFERRFEREAAIMARLRSPHILTVYDYGRHEDEFYLVTDYLAEGDLASHLDAHGPMAPDSALRLLAQVADGLADAHEHGVIHRDVKPANILLYRRGAELRAVLGDFGIAVAEDLSLTLTGGVVGSPLFMAPERHLGEPADEATDVYALGCVLVAVLTGRPPYYDSVTRGVFQAASAHLSSPVPTVPRSMPRADELDALIATCMAKAPGDRLVDAADLADRMRSLAELVARPEPRAADTVIRPAPDATPVAPADPARPSRRRGRRGLWAALVAVVLVGAVAGVALVAGSDDDPGSEAASDPPASTDTPPASSPPPSETSASATAAGSRPPAPPAPALAAEPGPYEVAFLASSEPPTSDGVRHRLERQGRDGTWVQSATEFSAPTRRPLERQCARVRLVALSEGGRTAGAPQRACGYSQPRAVDLERVDAPCDPADFGYPGGCHWVDVVLSGYRPGEQVQIDVFNDNQPAESGAPVEIGPDGVFVLGARPSEQFGRVPGGLPVQDGYELLRVEAGGVSKTFRLDNYR